ncbi:MAG: exonuclease subunit SbcD [Geodermatophilaceae bacterium]
MRLLHTSDWHIGRSLHGADLLADQERVLTGLADLIRAESVDVVLVAGDIYDRAIPPAAATAVLDSILTTLRATGAQLVITPGNHDSSIRLGLCGRPVGSQRRASAHQRFRLGCAGPHR